MATTNPNTNPNTNRGKANTTTLPTRKPTPTPTQAPKKVSLTVTGRATKLLPMGQYEGIITKLEGRETQYGPYCDYTIATKDPETGEPAEVRFGCNLNVSQSSHLGQLISRFTGEDIEAGRDYNLEEIFKDVPVSFTLVHATNPNGTFNDVVKESVLPA